MTEEEKFNAWIQQEHPTLLDDFDDWNTLIKYYMYQAWLSAKINLTADYMSNP